MRTKSSLLALWLSIVLAFSLVPAHADSRPDVIDFDNVEADRLGSVSALFHAVDNQPLPGVEVRLYRIAEMRPGLPFVLDDSYATAIGWKSLTDATEPSDPDLAASATLTLQSLLERDGVVPTAQATSDSAGQVRMQDLQVGVYLMTASTVKQGAYRYVASPAIFALPQKGSDGELDYDVVVAPKLEPQKVEPTKYRLVKLWQDEPVKDRRPTSIQVDVLADGKLFKRVTLSAQNDWTFEWQDETGDRRWSVAEKLSGSYEVRTAVDNNVFTLTNVAPEPENPEPEGPLSKTGMDGKVGGVAIVLFLTGLVLIGAGRVRGRNERA